MENKELIIKIESKNICFNSTLSVPFRHTNLPPNEYLKFKDNIYFKIKMLNYESENQCLEVEIQEYNCKEISSFGTRLQTKEVTKLKFNLPFNWEKLDAISYSSNKGKLMELGYLDKINLTDDTINQNTIINNFNNPKSLNPIEQKIREVKYSDCPVKFENAQFKSGRIIFNGQLNGEKVFFDVENVHILEKFDFIKSWFTRKLNISKWKVDLIVSLAGNTIIGIKATSKDVNRITPELIESVKYDRTVNLIKNPSTEDSNQELFSVEELFSQIDREKMEKNTFEQSGKDILNILLIKKGRNRKQLEYLSEEKQSLNYPLKFTLSPHFGFLFTIESNGKNHYVWELLETHATYIWSINKLFSDVESQFKVVENAVSIINKFGRDEYRKNYQKNDAFTFNHINHNKIITKQDEHFVLWKDKLNEYLS